MKMTIHPTTLGTSYFIYIQPTYRGLNHEEEQQQAYYTIIAKHYRPKINRQLLELQVKSLVQDSADSCE